MWRRKLWELNAGLMGLALSLALTFTITQGMKIAIGKPRPNFLARCHPDLDLLGAFQVGRYSPDMPRQWALVTSEVCNPRDDDTLQEGFKSFPSGHASLSWGGLFYLTLFLCSKLSIAIPFLPPRLFARAADEIGEYPVSNRRSSTDETSNKRVDSAGSSHGGIASVAEVPIRNQAAAPPVHLIVIALVPLGAALYISLTRYVQYNHFGIDIFAGALLGILAAWFAFRWYQMPIRQGAGWAWGPRSADRAFGVGVGIGRYVNHTPSTASPPSSPLSRSDPEAPPELEPPSGPARDHRQSELSFNFGSRDGALARDRNSMAYSGEAV